MDEAPPHANADLDASGEAERAEVEGQKITQIFHTLYTVGLGGFGEKIQREGGILFDLDAAHDAMITEPEKLALILDKIASV